MDEEPAQAVAALQVAACPVQADLRCDLQDTASGATEIAQDLGRVLGLAAP